MALLSFVNLGLYALQIFVNGLSAHNIGPMSRRYETLITPAPYAFSIWGFIYTFLALTAITDCFLPSASFFTSSSNPTLLRGLFAVSCLMNMSWIVFFTNEYVNVATLTLVVLWLSLFVLYAHIAQTRRDSSFELKRYVLSELGVTVYFAWTCAATLISFAVTAQYLSEDYLSLTSYIALLALLAVATLSAVIYEGDVAFGLVAIWALVGLATKTTVLEQRVELMTLNIRACATQSAAIVAAFIVISIANKLLAPKTNFQGLQSGAPLVDEKNAHHINYGSTPQLEAAICIIVQLRKNRLGETSMPNAMTPETAKLPWINIWFFAFQTLLTCIGLAVGDASDVRAQHNTLITPADYAFSIWNVIYLLCMILLISDVSYAGLSLYDAAAKPNSLRLCFAASCVVNGVWCIVLASGSLLATSVLVSLLWLTLLPLYVFASYERHLQSVVWREYLCSELCVRLYFAWITVETVVSWTMTLQSRAGGSLSLAMYLTLLAGLIVVALAGLAHGRDPVIALVVAWALVGVTSNDVSTADHAKFDQLQAAAALGAGVLVAMALVSCSYWLALELNGVSKIPSPRMRKLSRMSGTSTKDDYGSIRLVSSP